MNHDYKDHMSEHYELARPPKILGDLCEACREIGVLLIALAPLDGMVSGHKGLLDPEIVSFVNAGVIVYAATAMVEALGLYCWKKHLA